MALLRVLILRQDQIVDVHTFEDPREEFVREFNQLNHDTTYSAVVEEDPSQTFSNRMRTSYSHRRTCEDI
ncbi:MAG: hypothetical protein GY768_31900 [Planctomycetaceae bacterium]|nr:hypothetical protein [Planctomycetaceae bacterium]